MGLQDVSSVALGEDSKVFRKITTRIAKFTQDSRDANRGLRSAGGAR